MNGINIISDKIMSEAREKAAQIVSEANEQANLILDETSSRAEVESDRIIESARLRAADIEEKARLASELEAKKMLSNVRQDMIRQTFELTLKRLVSLPQEDYCSLLLSLAEKAVADGNGGELLLNKSDRENHGAAVISALEARKIKNVTLAKDTVDISGGIIIRRGSIELNSSLDVIVHMLSQDAAFEVSNALFS